MLSNRCHPLLRNGNAPHSSVYDNLKWTRAYAREKEKKIHQGAKKSARKVDKAYTKTELCYSSIDMTFH